MKTIVNKESVERYFPWFSSLGPDYMSRAASVWLARLSCNREVAFNKEAKAPANSNQPGSCNKALRRRNRLNYSLPSLTLPPTSHASGMYQLLNCCVQLSTDYF